MPLSRRRAISCWKSRSVEELSDSLLPKTVPQYTSELAWLMLGNSIAARMAVLGVGELNARWQEAKKLLGALVRASFLGLCRVEVGDDCKGDTFVGSTTRT